MGMKSLRTVQEETHVERSNSFQISLEISMQRAEALEVKCEAWEEKCKALEDKCEGLQNNVDRMEAE